jgi:hypothetical protein
MRARETAEDILNTKIPPKGHVNGWEWEKGSRNTSVWGPDGELVALFRAPLDLLHAQLFLSAVVFAS